MKASVRPACCSKALRFILGVILALCLTMVADRSNRTVFVLAETESDSTTRTGDEEEKLVIYHQWLFDCGSGLGTPSKATLYVNVTGSEVEFSEYTLDFENRWSLRDPTIGESSSMDGLPVHTEYILMFDYTYEEAQYYAMQHTATFRVDGQVWPHGYELVGTTGIEIVNETTCNNAVRTPAPTVSPAPIATPTAEPLTSSAVNSFLWLTTTLCPVVALASLQIMYLH